MPGVSLYVGLDFAQTQRVHVVGTRQSVPLDLYSTSRGAHGKIAFQYGSLPNRAVSLVEDGNSVSGLELVFDRSSHAATTLPAGASKVLPLRSWYSTRPSLSCCPL